MFSKIWESERLIYLNKLSETKSEEIFQKLPQYFPLHRLDTNTTGILVMGKTKVAADLFKNLKDEIQKSYLCIVNGAFPKEKMTQDFDLEITKEKVFFRKTQNSKTCSHEIRRLARNDRFSCLLVTLKTGRKHQIRAGLKALNHSIIGDMKYGNGKHFKRQALHAYAINIPGDALVIAELPKDFISALKSFCGLSLMDLEGLKL